ncbi:hypothetical protein BASA60_001476 [Batrachochytrium salamandrivorans]|nr:hypothetical protein BASA60_001476 [Batrachochytrium salamandrivorans]
MVAPLTPLWTSQYFANGTRETTLCARPGLACYTLFRTPLHFLRQAIVSAHFGSSVANVGLFRTQRSVLYTGIWYRALPRPVPATSYSLYTLRDTRLFDLCFVQLASNPGEHG